MATSVIINDIPLQVEQQVEPCDKDGHSRANVQITGVDVEEEKRHGHDATGQVQHPFENVDKLAEVTKSLRARKQPM